MIVDVTGGDACTSNQISAPDDDCQASMATALNPPGRVTS